MRGRTLSNSFVIVDEAQNTTPVQMKMLLTRLGENSRMVVTGDLSQIDLPAGVRSGLRDAIDVLGRGRGHQLHLASQTPTSCAMRWSAGSFAPMTSATAANSRRMSRSRESEYPVCRIMGAMAVEFDIAVRILDPGLAPHLAEGRRSCPQGGPDRARRHRKRTDRRKGSCNELAIVFGRRRRGAAFESATTGASTSRRTCYHSGDASDGRRRARGELVILGDVVLARETVAAEAAAQGRA